MNTRDTITIAIPKKSGQKIKDICKEIKERTGECLSAAEIFEFMISKFSLVATELKIMKLKEETDKVDQIEIEKMINELENVQ